MNSAEHSSHRTVSKHTSICSALIIDKVSHHGSTVIHRRCSQHCFAFRMHCYTARIAIQRRFIRFAAALVCMTYKWFEHILSHLGHATRLALRHVYGADYATRGWSTFNDHGAPVVYVSPALHLDIGAYLTSEFGIADTIVIDKFDTSTLADVEGRLVRVIRETVMFIFVFRIMSNSRNDSKPMLQPVNDRCSLLLSLDRQYLDKMIWYRV